MRFELFSEDWRISDVTQVRWQRVPRGGASVREGALGA